MHPSDSNLICTESCDDEANDDDEDEEEYDEHNKEERKFESSATRRLTNSKVRSIFECLYNKALPPPVPFIIVPVNSNGKALSPPSYEFEYGLYVLLRPAKGAKSKSNDGDKPQAPKHLEHLLMKNFPPETCKWQLSGPQFPTPTAIQQRYCYPQGREEYSQCTGSALWTMYNVDGVENKEFRLLHVYYSTKRLYNGGVRNGKHDLGVMNGELINDDIDSVYSPIQAIVPAHDKPVKPPKRLKTIKYKYHHERGQLKQLPKGSHNNDLAHSPNQTKQEYQLPPQSQQQQQQQHTTPIDFPMSPIRYGPSVYNNAVGHGYTVSPPSPWPDPPSVAEYHGNSGSYTTSYFRPPVQTPYQRSYHRSMLSMVASNSTENPSPNYNEYSHETTARYNNISANGPISQHHQHQVLPFRRQQQQHHHWSDFAHINQEFVSNSPSLPPVNAINYGEEQSFRVTNDALSTGTVATDLDHDDIHSIMMSPINHSNDDDGDDASVTLWDEVSGGNSEHPNDKNDHNDPFTRMTTGSSRHINKPLSAIGTKESGRIVPSTRGNYFNYQNHHRPNKQDEVPTNGNFQASLENVHKRLRDCIHNAPINEQPELVHLLSTWARQLANDPMIGSSTTQSSDDTTNTKSTLDKISTETTTNDVFSITDFDMDHFEGILDTRKTITEEEIDKECAAV